ncbi:MAG: hypothetical protein Q4D81_03485 [Eubacteriales bacterium]|nr:hypothetical protein [Eubacteriales bacterium]
MKIRRLQNPAKTRMILPEMAGGSACSRWLMKNRKPPNPAKTRMILPEMAG